MSAATPVVFIPALLCDEAMYRDVVTHLGDAIEADVMLSPKPRFEDSVTDILGRAPAKMPALVVWGDADPLAPVAVGRALASGLPNAQFHLLEECGHLPTLEKPLETAALFREFLDANARR